MNNETDYDYMEEREIDLVKLFKFTWKKIWIMIAAAVIGGIIGFVYYQFTATSSYQSSAVYRTYQNKTTESGTTETNQAANAIAILQQTPTLQAVIDDGHLTCGTEELLKMITATATSGTDFFTVTVAAEDANEAKRILDSISAVLSVKLPAVYENAKVEIIDPGQVSLEPTKTSRFKYPLIGLIGGFAAALIAITLIYFIGKNVYDDDFVNRMPVRLPLLITLPKENRKAQKDTAESAVLSANTKEELKDAYDLLRKNMLFALDQSLTCPVFGVTSAIQGEGKTVTAINIALTFAKTGSKVLLLEGALRTPMLANYFKQPSSAGLSDVLKQETACKEALLPSGIHDNLFVMTAGHAVQNPTILLESTRMCDLMNALRQDFDCIIVDLPPVNDGTDTLTLSACTDGSVLIVRQEFSKIPALKEAVQKLRFAKANLLGYVYL